MKHHRSRFFYPFRKLFNTNYPFYGKTVNTILDTLPVCL